MGFSFSLSMLEISMLIMAAVVAVVLIAWYIHRYNIVACANRRDLPVSEELQPVSIIVYTCNDAQNLREMIPALMSQNYPLYEVIVVDDSPTDATKDLLLELSLQYRNLYSTFIPNGTLNLSRKKLAITLGVKAAKYDIVLTTSGCCIPSGENWLRGMMRNFVPYVDVVIGFSHPDYDEDSGVWKYYRRLDDAVDASQYLSYALRGKTFRGDGNNLAYRKHIFFDNKGFSQSLNLHYGDDDLFVSEITNNKNTRVELCDESQMTVRVDSIADTHKELKLRYDFTAQYLNTWAKKSSSVITMLNFLMLAISILVVLVSLPNFVPVIAVVLLQFAVWGIQIVMYKRVSRILHTGKLLMSVPILLLLRPIINIKYKLLGRHYRKFNYTWQRRRR